MKRKSNTRLYEVFGEELTVPEACKKYNVSYYMVNNRLHRQKMGILEALFRPKHINRNQGSDGRYGNDEWNALSDSPRDHLLKKID